MEVIIRVVLMFFFVQFLVVTIMMVVALLLARLEVPPLGRESGHAALRRSLAFVIHLPSQVLRSVTRLMHFMHLLRGAH